MPLVAGAKLLYSSGPQTTPGTGNLLSPEANEQLKFIDDEDNEVEESGSEATASPKRTLEATALCPREELRLNLFKGKPDICNFLWCFIMILTRFIHIAIIHMLLHTFIILHCKFKFRNADYFLKRRKILKSHY